MRGADGGESSGLSTASPPCIIASALEGLDSSRLPWHMPGPTVLVLCIFGTLEPVVGFCVPTRAGAVCFRSHPPARR